jgi:hypothetical protein
MWVTVGKVLGKEAIVETGIEEIEEGEGEGTGGTGWCAYSA